MKINIPTSLKVFVIVMSIVLSVYLAAVIFSHYRVDKKYSMILAFFLFISLAFTTIGIYTGFKFKAENIKSKIQNRIGLIGNLAIFTLTIGLMLFAALFKPH